MSAKTNHVNLNLGTSSLLLIFVVLSLVSFAVLSLSSALSDKKLTDKTVEKNVSYYSACNEAYEKLADLDKKLIDIYKASADEASYLKACEDLDLEMIIPVTEYQGLEVKVIPNYPLSDEDTFYSIRSWKLIHTSEPKLDFSINVMK
ncbi:MAG: hypothetical protein J6Z05_06910 [Lachnospiraceae bacterium]|nr:hypothetical protein [Lachnospiraceae bacterium]